MVFKFSDRSLRNLEGVHQPLIDIAHEALAMSEVDFSVIEGFRSVDRQYRLWKEGKSRLNGIPVGEKRNIDGEPVGGTGISKHTYRLAIDVAAFVDGEITWSEDKYYPIAEAFRKAALKKGAKVRWGGHWHTLRERQNDRSLVKQYMDDCKLADRKPLVDLVHYELLS